MRSSPMMISRLPTAKRTKCSDDFSSVLDAAKTISAKRSRRSNQAFETREGGRSPVHGLRLRLDSVAPVSSRRLETDIPTRRHSQAGAWVPRQKVGKRRREFPDLWQGAGGRWVWS